MIKACQDAGMKAIADIVVNHRCAHSQNRCGQGGGGGGGGRVCRGGWGWRRWGDETVSDAAPALPARLSALPACRSPARPPPLLFPVPPPPASAHPPPAPRSARPAPAATASGINSAAAWPGTPATSPATTGSTAAPVRSRLPWSRRLPGDAAGPTHARGGGGRGSEGGRGAGSGAGAGGGCCPCRSQSASACQAAPVGRTQPPPIPCRARARIPATPPPPRPLRPPRRAQDGRRLRGGPQHRPHPGARAQRPGRVDALPAQQHRLRRLAL